MIFSIIACDYVAKVLGLHMSHVYFVAIYHWAGSTRYLQCGLYYSLGFNFNIVHIFGYILVG